MAGYIFSLDNLDSLTLYAVGGVYATKLSAPSGLWQSHHEGTFADYVTMQEGDNIYFFIKRKIYGIGKLVNVGTDCKYFNFPGAGTPEKFDYKKVKDSLLWDEGEFSELQRCICVFEPDPHFFKLGIDMDDVLSSKPSAFKMLRAFWKLSFVKFDDDENQAFRDIVLKRNQDALADPRENNGIFEFKPAHEKLVKKLSPEYELNSGLSSVLSSCADNDHIRHEMALEAGLLHQLSIKEPETCRIFGEWDYLSHQVVASPFKPVDYMDKMDLFGYSYIPGFRPTKSKYLVGEVKKDAAKIENVDQLLKYADWVRDEYCFGDYSMIKAFLIAYNFDDEILQHKNSAGIRKYTSGVRPTRSLEWTDFNLVKYSFNKNTGKIEFTLI